MLSFSMPTIFARGWFWLAIISVVIAINYFWGKPLSPAKPNKFFLKHKKTIYRLSDAFIILIVVLVWLPCVIFEVSIMRSALSDPEPVRDVSLQVAQRLLASTMIQNTAASAFFLGLLSIFRSNLTKIKRLILLFISLLPMLFTILALLVCPAEDRWSVLQLGVITSLYCWVMNGPAIIAGKHFVVVGWMVMRALRLVSGEIPS